MVNIIKNFGDWKMIKESEILNSKFQEILSISNLKIIPLGNAKEIEFSKIKDSELWRKMAKRDWILGKYENTKDFQTFLGDYVEWYQIEKSGGKYNIFQGFLIKFENKIGFVKCKDPNAFYVPMTQKTIQLQADRKNYIYNTSNGGRNWVLQDPISNNEKFPKELEEEKLKILLGDNEIKVKVI